VKSGVDLSPGNPFEKLGAVFGAGLDKGIEIALCKQDRATELVEAEADTLLELLQGVGLLVTDDRAGLEVSERNLLI
jgi:hypothetical protein